MYIILNKKKTITTMMIFFVVLLLGGWGLLKLGHQPQAALSWQMADQTIVIDARTRRYFPRQGQQ